MISYTLEVVFFGSNFEIETCRRRLYDFSFFYGGFLEAIGGKNFFRGASEMACRCLVFSVVAW